VVVGVVVVVVKVEQFGVVMAELNMVMTMITGIVMRVITILEKK
jgi:hypothetical protein